MKKDIVYILREGIDSEELRYSLRSVCKNFEYNKIWFYGGCPKNIKPDEYVPFKQQGYNKLDRVRSTIHAICANDKITSEFYLFNDDFFIMQPYEQDISLCNGSLDHVAFLIEQRNGQESFYTQYVKYTSKVLKNRGYDSLSYACHVPLLVNRQKGLQTLNEFPSTTLFRSVYGNHHQLRGRLIEDVKIVDYDIIPDDNCVLLSTNEQSFANGRIGVFIRECFPEPCKYEKDWREQKRKNIKSQVKISSSDPVVKKEELQENTAEIKYYTLFDKIKQWLVQIKKDYFTFPYEE